MKTLLQPKNWEIFQHYKDRSPPWVKLHRKLLLDREWMALPVASKALAPMLWLLACEEVDGSFDASLEQLAFRLHMTEEECQQGLGPLIQRGFFVDASKPLAECLQVASKPLAQCLQGASNLHHFATPETETETETETKKERGAEKPESPRSPRGSRLSSDWQMTDEQKQFCQTARPDLVPSHVEANFRDYWIGVAGKAGVKLDWMAVWRTWVRREKAGPKSYAQVNADTARSTVEVNPDIAATLARNRADDAVARTGPDLETLKKIKEIRDAARGAA